MVNFVSGFDAVTFEQFSESVITPKPVDHSGQSQQTKTTQRTNHSSKQLHKISVKCTKMHASNLSRIGFGFTSDSLRKWCELKAIEQHLSVLSTCYDVHGGSYF